MEWQITFQKADSGFWDFLYEATHEELTTKIFCTNEGAIFWESYLIRSEFHPFWKKKHKTEWLQQWRHKLVGKKTLLY